MKQRTSLWVLNVHELFFRWGGSTVPGTAAVVPLNAGEVLSLSALNSSLQHPVSPKTFCRAANGTGNDGTLDHLHKDKRGRAVRQTDRQIIDR